MFISRFGLKYKLVLFMKCGEVNQIYMQLSSHYICKTFWCFIFASMPSLCRKRWGAIVVGHSRILFIYEFSPSVNVVCDRCKGSIRFVFIKSV